jgi:ESF2/ABP1 family protein
MSAPTDMDPDHPPVTHSPAFWFPPTPNYGHRTHIGQSFPPLVCAAREYTGAMRGTAEIDISTAHMAEEFPACSESPADHTAAFGEPDRPLCDNAATTGESVDTNAAGDAEEEAVQTKSKAFRLTKEKKLKKPKKSARKTGVVYLSRVPPGLDVGIVRSVLGRCGTLGRVWLRAEAREHVDSRRILGGRRNAGFSDGWVEFSRASDAETAVVLLHGQPMTGATRKGKFQNDLWCLKFLPGFVWDDLVEEVCGTRRERLLRVKSEVAAARRERAFVEEKAELARVMKRDDQARAGADAEMAGDSGDKPEVVKRPIVRRFRQKRPLGSAGDDDDEDRYAMQKLEREDHAVGMDNSAAIDGDLIAKLFKKKRRTGDA